MFTNNLFIVAEISANHLGTIENARKLVRAAKTAGADAVKFQTYNAHTMAADVAIKGGPWDGMSYRELYTDGRLPWGWDSRPRLASPPACSRRFAPRGWTQSKRFATNRRV